MGMFVEPTIAPDTETTRTCSICLKPLEYSQFYSDGKDQNGAKRYRRDCKECYRVARLRTRIAKRQPQITNRRKKK
jgi:hypothetical protein